MSTTEWVRCADDEDGDWRRPVGDGSIDVELHDDEVADFPPLVAALAESERLRALLDWLATCAGDTLAYVEAGHRLTHAEPVGDRCLTNCSEAWHVERDSLKAAIRDARAALGSEVTS